MSDGLKKIIPLDDPVGQVTQSWKSEDGLDISKIRSPFGVIGIIYEFNDFKNFTKIPRTK